jgi:hypothetical protein
MIMKENSQLLKFHPVSSNHFNIFFDSTNINQKFLNTLSYSLFADSPFSSYIAFSEVNYLSKPSSQSSPSTFGLNGGFYLFLLHYLPIFSSFSICPNPKTMGELKLILITLLNLAFVWDLYSTFLQ